MAARAAVVKRDGVPGTHRGPLVEPAQMNTGALLLAARQAGKFIEAPRLGTDVQIRITGSIVRTRISQRFHNPTRHYVTGTYVFPLPAGGAVDRLRLQIGARFLEGRIMPLEPAQRLLAQVPGRGEEVPVVTARNHPGVLRPNVFRNEVVNIGPGETVVVQLEYQQNLQVQDGRYRLRVPLTTLPRPLARRQTGPARLQVGAHGVHFSSAGGTVAGRARLRGPVLHPRRGRVNPLTIRVELDAGFALASLHSQHHEMRLQRLGAYRARLHFASRTAPTDRDFELTWQARAAQAPTLSLYAQDLARRPGRVVGGHGDGADRSTFLYALINPPTLSAAAAPPREVIFLLDTSASMSGASLTQARASLKKALRRLRAQDRFNFIHFNAHVSAFFKKPVAASMEHVAQVLRFIDTLEAGGRTRMLPALRAAFGEAGGGNDETDDGRVRQVVFLTDGAVDNEAELFSELASRRARARLFMVGIGAAPNSTFLRRAAEIGRGSFTHIRDISQVSVRMDSLLRKLERPAITDLKLVWPAGVKAEIFPDPLPDIYAGEPLGFVARTTALKGELLVEGRIGGRKWQHRLRLSAARRASGIAQLWARHKIDSLEARRYAGKDAAEIGTAVAKVGLAHGLITRRTVMVTAQVAPAPPRLSDLQRADLSQSLPAGWDFDRLFHQGDVFPSAQRLRLDRAQRRVLAHLVTRKDPWPGPMGRGAGAVSEAELAKLRYFRFSAGAVPSAGEVGVSWRRSARPGVTALASPQPGVGQAVEPRAAALSDVNGPIGVATRPTAALSAPASAVVGGRPASSSRPAGPAAARISQAQVRPQGAAGLPAGEAKEVSLPTSGQHGIIGTLAIIFSVMFAITVWLWHSFHHGVAAARRRGRRH